MADATTSVIKRMLSEYLRRVGARKAAKTADVRLQKLLAAGVLVREAGGRGERTSVVMGPVRLREPASLLETLLDGRRHGR